MIVKNEAANITDSLNSIRAAVDEMIVVDTGSEDATAVLAEQAGAKVFRFPWTNDFSAARNESIRHATGDYILWQDADDRMEALETRKIMQLKTMLPSEKNRAYYLVVQNESAEDGTICFSQLRLFPNIGSARFEWPIHEQLYNNLKIADVELMKTDIAVRHTGNFHAEDVVRKSKRNLEIIEASLAQDPENPVLHFQAARTLANLQKHEAALEHMRMVMSHGEVRHRHRQLYLEAGILSGRYLSEMGKTQEAEKMLRELDGYFPNHPLVHFYLGENLVKNEKYGEAIEVLKQTLETPLEIGFFPVNLNALGFQHYYYLGIAYHQSKEYELAKVMLEKSLNLSTDPTLSLQALGLLALQQGHYAAAADYYERVVKNHTAEDGHYSNLGLAYRRLNQFAKAEANFLKALGMNPERPEALVNLGHLYRENGDYPKALNCFSQVDKLEPGMPDVQLALGELYFRIPDFDALLKVCETLLASLNCSWEQTLDGMQDLGQLVATLGDAWIAQERPILGWLAYRLSVLIYPAVEVLEKAGPLARRFGEMKNLLDVLQESLGRFPQELEPVQKILKEIETTPAAVRV
jgi:tetratricopeptide (TPR) repeat protein